MTSMIRQFDFVEVCRLTPMIYFYLKRHHHHHHRRLYEMLEVEI